MEEVWKFIKGYENAYMVSNLGNVKNCYRKVAVINGFRTCSERMVTKADFRGYDKVLLSYKEKYEKNKFAQVHRLVADAFLDKIEGYDIVNHKDFNRKNNCVDNLEWCTTLMNIRHSSNSGRMNKAHKIVLKDIISGEEFVMYGKRSASIFLGYSKNHFDYRLSIKEKVMKSRSGRQFSYEIYNYKGEKL
jgi:hypothetical protein